MVINSILDVILLFGISIGLFISTALFFIKKQNNKANKILAIILILAVIMLLGRLFFLRYFKDVLLFRIGTTVDVTVFIFGPLVLHYLNILLFKNSPTKQLKPWYFLPALGYICFSIWTYTLGTETYYNKVITGAFNKFYAYIELFGILTNSFFVYKCYLALNEYKKSAKENLSFNQSIVTFSSYFLSAYVLCISFWIIGFINSYILRNYSKVFNYDIVWISIPIFIYIIGFYVLTQPEIFRLKNEVKAKKTKTNRISESKIEELKMALDRLLKEEKIYHKSDLSLSDLAHELNVSTNDLSWLINTNFNTNFYEYINKFRVEEFIERIKNGDSKRHTISAVSLDVGFNSKSTFYKAFKLITNTTPGNYINSINVNNS